MYGILKILIGGATVIGKIFFMIGIGTLLLIKPPFVDTDSHMEVIRTKAYVYQVNYDKDFIDSVEIFTKEGKFKGKYEYSELKGNHKKVIDRMKKE